MNERLKRLLSRVNRKLAAITGLEVRRWSPPRPITSRFEYQRHFIDFELSPGAHVLDIGSGGDPFPYATVLADRYLEPSQHRTAEFVTIGKPVVICDVHHLPFPAKSFDFVYCSHVLEHVDNPIQAAREIMRVGKRGYIETPHLLSDALFGWAKGMHKWFVQSIHNRLVFFEYDERRAKGIHSGAWRDMIFGPRYHPLQDAFHENRDLFDVMFAWEGDFVVDVYYCDGTVRHSEDGA